MRVTLNTTKLISDRIQAVQADTVLGVKTVKIVSVSIDNTENADALSPAKIELDIDMNKPEDLLFLGYWAHFKANENKQHLL